MEDIMIKHNSAPARDINIITAEIKDICRQAQSMALVYAVEIGRRLEEAKEALPYGKWGEWLKTEVEFSQSSANNYMKLYEEYGSSQISFFGASVDSQTFANLPYSKAIKLLAIPEEERENFAKEVDVESLSVRELQAAIDERDKARKEAEEAKKREAEIEERLGEIKKAEETAKAKAAEAEKLAGDLLKMKADLDSAKKKEAELNDKLKKAVSDPKIPKAKLDQIHAEVEKAVKEAQTKNVTAEIEKAKAEAERAQQEATKAAEAERQAKAKLAEMQEKMKTASPEITAFKTLFDEMQGTAVKLKAMIKKIQENSPETADKLEKALHAFGASL